MDEGEPKLTLKEIRALTDDCAEYLNRRQPSIDYYWRAGILETATGEQIYGLTKVWRQEPTAPIGLSSVAIIEAMKLPTHKGLIYDRH